MADKVRPIPDGSHSVTPYLAIRGAVEAVEFYKKAFGAVELMRMPSPDGKMLMHAELRIGDSPLYLADEFPGMEVSSPASLKGTTTAIHLYVDDVDAVFAKAVAAGATVKMPLINMFWGDRFGKIMDPFGHSWALAQHVEDVPPDEMDRRAEEFRKQWAEGKGHS